MSTVVPPAPRSATFAPTPSSRASALAPTPRWWRDATLATAWGLVLFVVALWVAGGGVADLTSFASGMTSLGRVTGLVASVLLLLQVALMARIPIVEQAWGQDELARVHRLVGNTSFYLMVAHIVLIIVGYNASGGLGIIGTFLDEVLNSPGMLLALAGTLALCLVVVTSIRAARARLRYESWHLLHLYAYLGAGLALPHQLWTGADFLSSTTATVFWWGLYLAVLGCVIAFRIVRPLWLSSRHQLRVADVVTEAPGVTSVVVRGRDLHWLAARGGQFFQWRFVDGPGWTRANPYSLSAAPDGRSLRITVAEIGDSSRRLRDLRPGTRVLVEGPYGRLHAGTKVARKSVLIGAGIGITPLRALLEELPGGPDETVLIHRVSTRADLVLESEIDALAQQRGARAISVIGHRRTDRASWLPVDLAHIDDAAALRHVVPDIAERDVFICGHPDWMDTVIAAALAAGVPREAIHHERFTY
ncbi:ferredoxin reductase family protein [Janibacter sp. G1551]|uniref:ferredoxin reductase family protein n=1 Tax=Janibacter sp. G1551 TaxID=3420440 RepID=UPI003D04AFCF